MDDPNLIAIVTITEESTSDSPLAATRSPSPTANELFGRPAKPLCPSKTSKSTKIEYRLTFDHPPNNKSKGYVFGIDRQCDIRPQNRSSPGVSPQHFSIKVDTQGRVVLQDHSVSGVTVKYTKELIITRENMRRLTWILFDDVQPVKVEMPLSDLEIEIEVFNHANCQEIYLANVHRFLQDDSDRDGSPQSLSGEKTTLATASGHSGNINQHNAVTTPDRPVYVRIRKLGSGTYGNVHQLRDVSTGQVYAGKTFYKGRKTDIRRAQSELKMMETLEHDHIVRFVGAHMSPDPLLVLECVELGSLSYQDCPTPLSQRKIVTTLVQALLALKYLHARDIAHRDIKPENILVASRDPLVIKLADFGLAKVIIGAKYATSCGSGPYKAPEIYDCEPYRTTVDIWSLGVTVLSLAYGLPPCPSDEYWPKPILEALIYVPGCMLVGFLRKNMLLVEPSDRGTASECLEKAIDMQNTLSPQIRHSTELSTLAERSYWSTQTVHPQEIDTMSNQLNRTLLALESCLSRAASPAYSIAGEQAYATESSTTYRPLEEAAATTRSSDASSSVSKKSGTDSKCHGHALPYGQRPTIGQVLLFGCGAGIILATFLRQWRVDSWK